MWAQVSWEYLFLHCRSSDGYVSATAMFQASFPYVTLDEFNSEYKYIREHLTINSEDSVGELWIPPEYALELAEEYHFTPWIQALLDETPIDL